LATLTALAAAFVCLPSNANAEEGAAEIEWSVGPASMDGPDQRISLRHTVEPGARVEDAIAVTNLSEAASAFTVTTGSGMVGQEGVFDIGEPGAEGPGRWIAVGGLDGDEVTLDAGETRILPVAISVPINATPGDQPAGIAVGVSQGEGLTVTHRIGVRVHLRVAGEVTPGLTARIVKASFTPSWIPFAPGTATIEYEIANVGNVRLGATVAALAAGPLGLGKAHADGEPLTELLPGEKATREMALRAVPIVRLNGTLAVTPVAVGNDGVRPPGPVTVALSVSALSATGIALVIVLLAAAAITLSRRSGRRAPRPRTADTA
jgi:hypothetical protein